MTDDVANLMLEHMTRFQASLDRVEGKVDDLITRFSDLGSSVALAVQRLASLSAAKAAQRVSIDNINSRLDRIERRLELTN